MPTRRNQPHLGLCAGPDGVWAVRLHGRRLLNSRFVKRSSASEPDGVPGDLMGEVLRGWPSPASSPLSMAFLPAWAPGRFIEASGGDAMGALRASTDRTRAEDVVFARGPGSAGRDGYEAHCPGDLLLHVADTLRSQGRAAEAVTPADHAWCAAAEEAAGRPHGLALCVVQLGGPLPETRILAAESGTPVALRRLPSDTKASGLASVLRTLAAHVGGDAAEVTLIALGDATFRERVHAAGSEAGLRVATSGGLLADLHFDPGFVAAAHAGVGPRLVPPQVVAAASARRRWWSVGMAAAGVVLLFLAGFLNTLDMSRELAAVRAARARVQDQVDAALGRTNAADELRAALADLYDLREASPRWSGVLGDLSERLPAGTYVTAVRTVGDSIFMEMEGEDAARAFEGIRGMRGLAAFRAAAPVRREVGEGSQVIERFTAAATVTWPRPREAPGGTR